MQISKKWCVLGFGFCLISVIMLAAQFVYFALNPLGPDNWGDHLEMLNPSRTIIADSLHLYGNATSTDVTQVLIRRRGERFDLRTNYCLLSVEGLRKTKVTWTSDSNLEIRYEPDIVYRKAPEWNDVRVSYSEIK